MTKTYESDTRTFDLRAHPAICEFCNEQITDHDLDTRQVETWPRDDNLVHRDCLRLQAMLYLDTAYI